jgi:uncharacterized protein (TIGR03000 family)
MIRTLTPLVVAGAVVAAAAAQPPVIRHGTQHQPAGVIAAPSLPIAGGVVGGVPGAAPARSFPRPALATTPYYGPWGYSPFWPVWYDTDPIPVVNTVMPVPVPVYATPSQTTIVFAAAAAELRARLALSVPMQSRVWVGGKEVDARSAPVVLESPPLQEGQSYTFDLKVTWPEGDKTEERTRSVTVWAGEQTSLAYNR